jgi:hypothetical protein
VSIGSEEGDGHARQVAAAAAKPACGGGLGNKFRSLEKFQKNERRNSKKMKLVSRQRFLEAYSGVLTAVFAITVFGGFADARKALFDEIDVHRINVVEPNGTLRMVISDQARFPGSFVNGKEIARPDRQDTGMLFLNEEGTEMGGLTFDGRKDKNGEIQNNGHLSFDQYMQDQVFSLDAGQDGGKHYSVITFTDRGDYSIMDAFEAKKRIDALPAEQREEEWKKFMETHPGDANRIVLGRATDTSAVLKMRDKQGRDRLVIKVAVDGSPVIQFLDEGGKVVSQLPAAK